MLYMFSEVQKFEVCPQLCCSSVEAVLHRPPSRCEKTAADPEESEASEIDEAVIPVAEEAGSAPGKKKRKRKRKKKMKEAAVE